MITRREAALRLDIPLEMAQRHGIPSRLSEAEFAEIGAGIQLAPNAFHALGCLGVEVVTVGRNLTHNEAYMHRRLRRTDLLVDASQRDDPTRALIPNAWLAWLPHAGGHHA